MYHGALYHFTFMPTANIDFFSSVNFYDSWYFRE